MQRVNTQTRRRMQVEPTAVCSSGGRWEVRTEAWIQRNGDPPSRARAVTLCVLVVVIRLHDTQI